MNRGPDSLLWSMCIEGTHCKRLLQLSSRRGQELLEFFDAVPQLEVFRFHALSHDFREVGDPIRHFDALAFQAVDRGIIESGSPASNLIMLEPYLNFGTRLTRDEPSPAVPTFRPIDSCSSQAMAIGRLRDRSSLWPSDLLSKDSSWRSAATASGKAPGLPA